MIRKENCTISVYFQHLHLGVNMKLVMLGVIYPQRDFHKIVRHRAVEWGKRQGLEMHFVVELQCF